MNQSETKNSAVSPDPVADLKEVCRQSTHGIVRDADLLQRIQRRSEKVRREIQEKHGIINIGVDIIRRMREGEE